MGTGQTLATLCLTTITAAEKTYKEALANQSFPALIKKTNQKMIKSAEISAFNGKMSLSTMFSRGLVIDYW